MSCLGQTSGERCLVHPNHAEFWLSRRWTHKATEGSSRDQLLSRNFRRSLRVFTDAFWFCLLVQLLFLETEVCVYNWFPWHPFQETSVGTLEEAAQCNEWISEILSGHLPLGVERLLFLIDSLSPVSMPNNHDRKFNICPTSHQLQFPLWYSGEKARMMNEANYVGCSAGTKFVVEEEVALSRFQPDPSKPFLPRRVVYVVGIYLCEESIPTWSSQMDLRFAPDRQSTWCADSLSLVPGDDNFPVWCPVSSLATENLVDFSWRRRSHQENISGGEKTDSRLNTAFNEQMTNLLWWLSDKVMYISQFCDCLLHIYEVFKQDNFTWHIKVATYIILTIHFFDRLTGPEIELCFGKHTCNFSALKSPAVSKDGKHMSLKQHEHIKCCKLQIANRNRTQTHWNSILVGWAVCLLGWSI